MPLREESSTCILYVSISVIGIGRQCRFICLNILLKKKKKNLQGRKRITGEEAGRERGRWIGNEWIDDYTERNNFTSIYLFVVFFFF